MRVRSRLIPAMSGCDWKTDVLDLAGKYWDDACPTVRRSPNTSLYHGEWLRGDSRSACVRRSVSEMSHHAEPGPVRVALALLRAPLADMSAPD